MDLKALFGLGGEEATQAAPAPQSAKEKLRALIAEAEIARQHSNLRSAFEGAEKHYTQTKREMHVTMSSDLASLLPFSVAAGEKSAAVLRCEAEVQKAFDRFNEAKERLENFREQHPDAKLWSPQMVDELRHAVCDYLAEEQLQVAIGRMQRLEAEFYQTQGVLYGLRDAFRRSNRSAEATACDRALGLELPPSVARGEAAAREAVDAMQRHKAALRASLHEARHAANRLADALFTSADALLGDKE